MKKILRVLFEHPALGVSFLSLYLMSLSYFNAFSLMENYGVNLSGYIFVEDLLILIFRNSYLISFMLLNTFTFAFYYLVYVYQTNKVAKRTREIVDVSENDLKKMTHNERTKLVSVAERNVGQLDHLEDIYSRSKRIGVLVYLIGSFGFANMTANWEYADIQQGKGEKVEVHLKKSDKSAISGREFNKILATSKYVFLESLDEKSGTRVLIIPYANVDYLYSRIRGAAQ